MKINELFAKAEAILITSPHHLQYVTGFRGGEGFAILRQDEKILLVDARYTLAAKEEAPTFTVVEYQRGGLIDELKKYLHGAKTIGIEDAEMTVTVFEHFKVAFDGAETVGVSGDLEMLRAIKSPEELECLRKAEQIGVDAFLAVVPQIRPGMKEYELAAELEYQMRKRGAEGTSFETIAVSGEKTAMPHGKPDHKTIRNGELITMDFGCRYKGYCSDMTRTVALGKISEEQKRIYDIVYRAQAEGLSAIRAGVIGREADRAARQVIEDAGFGKCFGHSLGHGVGLLIHEQPNLSPRSNTVLKPGMVVTCEPGIYVPGLCGVRIEDMVCVTESGCENLTHLDKTLLYL